MLAVQRFVGVVMVVAAAVLTLPQLVAYVPDLRLTVLGFLLALTGLGLIEDAREKDLGL